MSRDIAREAAVAAALESITGDTTIGLGSGRAIFALTAAVGARFGNRLRAVTASKETARRATAAGIEVVDLNDVNALDVAFDGADEVDPQLRVIKGKGAAMLWEKLIIDNAEQTVIVAEATKLSDRLGTNTDVPVEVVQFGWKRTLARLEMLSDRCILRIDDGHPVTTDENNYIVDVAIPESASLPEFAQVLKQTTGVVEHGLFLDQVNTALIGDDDGTVTRLDRPTRTPQK